MLIHTCYAVLLPCCTVALRNSFQNGMVGARHGHCMVCVDQTRPHCANQIEKTQSKPFATRQGRGTACYCELVLNAFIAVRCVKVGSISRAKPVQCIEEGNEGLLRVPINEDTLCLFPPPSPISDLNTQRCEILRFQKWNAL